MKRKQLRAGGKIGHPSKDTVASLYDAGLRHFQSGLFAVAEERVQRALALDPQHAGSLYLAGQLHAQANRVDLAIDFAVRAIRIDQGNPEYFSSLGSYLARQGRFAEALKGYEVALKLKPDGADVWVGIGDLQRQQKRFQEALLAYDHALSLDPRHLDAVDKAGSLLIELQLYAEALAKFEQSDTIHPGRPETLMSKGLCFQALMRREEAVASYAMALATEPKNYAARNNMGVVLLDMGRFEEAAAHFRKVTEARPDVVNAFSNLGLALTQLKRFDEALTVFDRAVKLDADFAEAINNRGNAMRQLDRLEQALADFDRAIALKPDYADAHANRAACLDDLSRSEEALASYDTALTLKPDHADAHLNRALNRLRAGDLKNGWVEAEWRWKAPSLRLSRGRSNRPLWLGAESIAGKTLLLHNDQGFGDSIQFCRYIPHLAERGASVILEIDRSLRSLLSGVAGIAQCVVKGETLPDHDLQCPLASLPLAFDTTIETIPSHVPYISVGGNAARWEAFLGSTARPRIGIVWSGNPDHTNDRNRSLRLKALKPLFDTAAQFVSLQKNARETDLAALREHGGILDAARELDSFADTAALIQQLDLVISVDTSVAHLAGALGKPVWILLPYVPDYRWLLDRDDTPWYPTARLYRQTATRDYAEVIDRMRADLLRDAAFLVTRTALATP
jgi:tetratricopeptide (TPR) repeat protein